MIELPKIINNVSERRIVNGKELFIVSEGYIVACFDEEVGDDTVKAMAEIQPQYAVLRDASMKDDATATNFEQLFKTYSPQTKTKIM